MRIERGWECTGEVRNRRENFAKLPLYLRYVSVELPLHFCGEVPLAHLRGVNSVAVHKANGGLFTGG